MTDSVLHIQMLGGFSLKKDGVEITDSDNRMRKVWLLLGYLIYRRAPVSSDEIISLLWRDDEELSNPAGALKTMLYRVRTLLNGLGETAGKNLILRRENGYIWNRGIPCVLDVVELDELNSKAAAEPDDETRLALQRRILELYHGDFLPKLASEAWVMPISAYYHRLYLDVLSQVLPRLEEKNDWEEVGALCNAALKVEPYEEEIYCHLMKAYLAQGAPDAAAALYENMSDLLFSHFGVLPSDEARGLYRRASAARADNLSAVNVSNARDLLREDEPPEGALFCEYDFFRFFYQALSRAIIRSGDSIHIILMTVTGKNGAELARRSRDRAAENLKQLLVNHLRQGDIITQCSSAQFMILLPQANYENSCMVCDRLVRAFFRQYPHSPADLRYSVQPMEPANNLPE